MKTVLVALYVMCSFTYAWLGKPIMMKRLSSHQKESVKHFSTSEIDAVWLKTGYLSHDLKSSGVGCLKSFQILTNNKLSEVRIEQTFVCERFQHEDVVIYVDDKRAFAVPHLLPRQIFLGPRTLLQRVFLRFHFDGNNSKQEHFYVVIDNGHVYCTEVQPTEYNSRLLKMSTTHSNIQL